MSSLLSLGIALAALAGAAVLFVVVPRALIAQVRGGLKERVRQRYADPSSLLYVEYSANSFRGDSISAFQWRSKGALVLTRDELCFFHLAPPHERWLPLARILETELIAADLGKSTPSRLLRVVYRGKESPQAMVYWVFDPPALKALLDARLTPNVR